MTEIQKLEHEADRKRRQLIGAFRVLEDLTQREIQGKPVAKLLPAAGANLQRRYIDWAAAEILRRDFQARIQLARDEALYGPQ